MCIATSHRSVCERTKSRQGIAFSFFSLKLAVEGESLETLYKVLKWSLDALLSGWLHRSILFTWASPCGHGTLTAHQHTHQVRVDCDCAIVMWRRCVASYRRLPVPRCEMRNMYGQAANTLTPTMMAFLFQSLTTPTASVTRPILLVCQTRSVVKRLSVSVCVRAGWPSQANGALLVFETSSLYIGTLANQVERCATALGNTGIEDNIQHFGVERLQRLRIQCGLDSSRIGLGSLSQIRGIV